MHYEDLISRLRRGTGLPVLQALMNEAAEAIEVLSKRCEALEREIDPLYGFEPPKEEKP